MPRRPARTPFVRAPTIASSPYRFPHDGLVAGRTALVLIDMQRDFLDEDGYLAAMGYDLGSVRAAVPAAARLLAAARRAGLTVIHTRQGYRADLADLPPHRAALVRSGLLQVGKPGPLGRFLVRGEPGFAIVDAVAPIAGEPVSDKTANSAFSGTDFDMVLRARGIASLIVAGITTDVCVHSTLRDAADRGYECLLATDACGSGDPEAHRAALTMMQVEAGIHGATADTAAIVTALDALTPALLGGRSRRPP
jgi:nicotinamidase-related amidase